MKDNLNILLLEDDVASCVMLSRVLQVHNVDVSNDIPNAIRNLIANKYDYMIVDININGKNNDDTAIKNYKWIQKFLHKNELEIIIITAYRPEDYNLNNYKVFRKGTEYISKLKKCLT